jgi:reverse gyrase
MHFDTLTSLAIAAGVPKSAISLAITQDRQETTLNLLVGLRRNLSSGTDRKSKRRFRTALRKLQQKITVVEGLLANTREVGRLDPAFDAAVAWLSEYRAKAQED